MSGKSIASQIVEAIKAEDIDLFKRLFEENPTQRDIHTPFGSQTWLGYAAQIGKLKSIKELESLGLDINLGDKREARKPICSAAANDHSEVVEYLLSRGADLDTDLAVRNPLFAAIVGNSIESIHLLLESGINVDVRYDSDTMHNMDALAFAVMRGCIEGARLIALSNVQDTVQAEELLIEAREIAESNTQRVKHAEHAEGQVFPFAPN